MLQKYGVDVEEVNIVKDARAKNFLARVGKLTVPKVYINNVLFATYDELATMNKDETLVKMELLKRMVN
jgi:glutaredoxin